MWIQAHAGLPVFAGCPFSAFFFFLVTLKQNYTFLV